MNIVFLDYDGVVNIPMFKPDCKFPQYNYPSDGMVNNYQACRWVSELCRETNSKIVVTSTWRKYNNYQECLYEGGLDSSIEIIGKTKSLYKERTRGSEINYFIKYFKDTIDNFVIIDDEDDMEPYLDHLVQCNHMVGFTYLEFVKALDLLRA